MFANLLNMVPRAAQLHLPPFGAGDPSIFGGWVIKLGEVERRLARFRCRIGMCNRPHRSLCGSRGAFGFFFGTPHDPEVGGNKPFPEERPHHIAAAAATGRKAVTLIPRAVDQRLVPANSAQHQSGRPHQSNPASLVTANATRRRAEIRFRICLELRGVGFRARQMICRVGRRAKMPTATDHRVDKGDAKHRVRIIERYELLEPHHGDALVYETREEFTQIRSQKLRS